MNRLGNPGDNLKKLKVVQISASLDNTLGGPVQVIGQTSLRFRESFNHVLILFGIQNSSIVNEFTVPTFRQNRYGLFFRRLNIVIRNEICSSNVLIVHGFYLYCTLVAIALAKKNRILIMPHGSLEQYQNKVGRYRKMIFDRLFSLLARFRNISFIVGSADEIEGVRSKFKNFPIHVLGLGVDEVPSDYLRKNGIQETVKLLSLSRITKKKRIDLCIEAVRVLRARGIEATLTIAGTGSNQIVEQLRDLVRRYDLEASVQFIGFVDGQNKDELYINSDIFLLPSENENFAVAVAESIMRRVPVVVSNRVAMHRFVERHKTGVVVENLEVISFVDAIYEVYSNHDIYWQGCLNSRHLLLWDNVFEEWKRFCMLTEDAAT